MRKIIFGAQVSLDGYMAGPNGELDWAIADEEIHYSAAELFDYGDTLLYGRVTYQLMEDYWPTALEDASLSDGEKEFARAYNAKAKIVFSKTLDKAGRDARILHEVVPQEIQAMKQQPGKDLLLGGADLASTFMKDGLIDEYHLWMQPVVLGSGKRLFKDGSPLTHLKLVSTRTFDSGVVLLHYRNV